MQHIAEEIMVGLQHTTFEISSKIFCMDELFPAYANEVTLDPLMAKNSTADANTMYIHESMNQPDSNDFKKVMKKE